MNLEVIVTYKKKKYEAKCPLYPHCNGLGKSKAEALHQLSESISRQVKRDAKEDLSHMFKQQNYIDILDVSLEGKDQEHRVYSLKQTNPSFLKDVQLKLNELPELSHLPNTKHKADSVNDFLEALKSDAHPQSDIHLKENTISRLDNPLKSQEDGFIFGIPLSLN